MDTEQMKKRCKSANKIGTGKLENYDIIFNRRGSYRPGGVASIQFKEGKSVYGVIWQINFNDLLKLDEIEDPKAYERKILSVIDSEDQKHDCYVYIAKPLGIFEPDKRYLELMFKAANAENLPKEYIKRLELFISDN
jgi:gamma-glutamylcyclotransferase (GGCT)/AIG2-like uncharacterized protein YtfP